MTLADEVNEKIRAFAHGHLVARELEGWLDATAATIHSDGDPNLRSRTDRILTILSEVDYGHRTTEEARQQLAAMIVDDAIVDRDAPNSPGLESRQRSAS